MNEKYKIKKRKWLKDKKREREKEKVHSKIKTKVGNSVYICIA
jgi:hypothetical protein